MEQPGRLFVGFLFLLFLVVVFAYNLRGKPDKVQLSAKLETWTKHITGSILSLS